MKTPPYESKLVPAEAAVKLGLESEEARHKLVQAAREARRELICAVGSTGVAGLAFGIEAWATFRGEPVFGWLISVLFTGFSIYFWARRRRVKGVVASLDEDYRLLEARWTDASVSDPVLFQNSA